MLRVVVWYRRRVLLVAIACSSLIRTDQAKHLFMADGEEMNSVTVSSLCWELRGVMSESDMEIEQNLFAVPEAGRKDNSFFILNNNHCICSL